MAARLLCSGGLPATARSSATASATASAAAAAAASASTPALTGHARAALRSRRLGRVLRASATVSWSYSSSCSSAALSFSTASLSSSPSIRPRVPLSLPQLPLHKAHSHPGTPVVSLSSRLLYLPPVSPAVMHSHSHSGHGGHHHHHDNSYLVSSNKNDAGVRITRIGLYVNLGMAVTKGIGGVMFNSQALVADAWHALTDLVSDFLTLATISVALKPPTAKYPNGFGKVESFGSLLVSGLLLIGGVIMARHSAESLYTQLFADVAHHVHDHAHHGHDHSHSFFGHSHSAHDMIPDVKAAWLAGGSILVKEWLYRATKKIARERKSAVLDSNAVHHRVDSLTSLVALLAIGGANIWESATWLDPVGGLLVSVMIIQAGWGNTRSAVLELCDSTIDDEVKQNIKRAATRALQEDTEDAAQRNALRVRSVEGIKAGQNYLVDIQVGVPPNTQLTELSQLEQLVRTRVGGKVRGVRRVRVRFVSDKTDDESASPDFADEFIPGDVSPRESPEPEDHDHDHDHSHGHGHDHSHSHDHTNGSSSASAAAAAASGKTSCNATVTKRK